MAKLINKRPIGIALCIFFCVLIFSYVYQYLINKLGLYNETITPITWIIQNIICCAAFCIIFFNSTRNLPVLIGSGILAIINFLFTINVATHFADVNIFAFLGQYYSFILSFIELVASGLIFFGLKMWLPLQITGFLYFIPAIFSAYFISGLNKANEVFAQTRNISYIDNLLKAIDISDVACFILVIASFVLTIIWLNKKSATPSSVSNPINLI